MKYNKIEKDNLVYSEMFRLAKDVRENAYTPYSQYKVGACVLMKNGKMFTGCNVENSSYGLTVCAERNAIFKAVSNGYKPGDFKDILIVTDSKDSIATACGACRQVIVEFFDGDSRIINANLEGDYFELSLEELLPFAFTKEDLD